MDSPPPTPRLALVPFDEQNGWHAILEASNQVVLYNPASHALTVTTTQPLDSPGLDGSPVLARRPSAEVESNEVCPLCHRPLPGDTDNVDAPFDTPHEQFGNHSRASDYFHLLAAVNETSRPTSPSHAGNAFASGMADGYFTAFFREVRRLGMGANGVVWLCEHVLDGNVLGECQSFIDTFIRVKLG